MNSGHSDFLYSTLRFNVELIDSAAFVVKYTGCDPKPDDSLTSPLMLNFKTLYHTYRSMDKGQIFG